ncbi:MAG: pyocin knob domain-containing protein [Acutalibacteraceae bacterium]|nr:pyocin knob domain-containing protein [Acutalibacteraceae bacterium]
MKFMSDTSLSELVTKIKNGFLPVKEISTDTGESGADLDTYQTTGIYIITGDGADEPPGDNKRGYLIVLKDSHFALAQFWIERYVDSFYLDFPVYCRQRKISTWSDWMQYPSWSYVEFLDSDLRSTINNKIQDSTTATTSTWSSDKINTQLGNKLDTSDFTLSNITGTLPIANGGTGATTRSDAYKNLSFEVHTCTTLSQDNTYYTDADSLTEAGNYYLQRPSGGTAPVISVSENPVNGWLMVIPGSGTQVKQLFYRFGSATTHCHIFVRTKLNTGWSAWERLFTTKDVIPIANGGTGATTVGDVLTNLGITTANSGDTGSLKIGNILVQWGRLNVATVPDSESSYQKITFDSSLQYSSTPRVFVNSLTNLPNQVKATATANTSGITLYIYSTEARSNVGFDWVTIGVTA